MQLTPRYYQTEAAEAVYPFWFPFSGIWPVVVLPTGAGKSLTIALIVEKVVKEWQGRVILCTHVKELIEQNAAELQSVAPDLDIGIYSAGLGRRDLEHDVLVCGIQSVYKRAHELGRRHAVIIDECFVGSTQIDTLEGRKRIDSIQVGESLFTATGIGKVIAARRTISTDIWRVKFDDGTSVECTGNHPIFTGAGWIKASELEAGAIAYGREAVRELWERDSPLAEGRSGSEGKVMDDTEVLRNILLQEAQQPHEQRANQEESSSNNEAVEASTHPKGGERAATSRCSIGPASCSWPGVGVGIASGDRSTRRTGKLSDMLQAGYRQPGNEDWNRAGWAFSSHGEEKTGGREENRLSQIKRVASVSRLKRTRPCFVFNLQVSGHPSFFANGVLAHNCHLVPDESEGMYRTFLLELSAYNPKLRGCGTTATPFRTSTGPLCHPKGLFQKVAYSAPVTRLIADGYLCPITNQPTETTYDTSRLTIRGGEFISREVEALFNEDDQKIVQAVGEALAKATGRHSLLWFCSGVRHAEKVAAEIARQSGERVECVTGETLPLLRSTALDDFKAMRLRHLVNVDVYTTGMNAKVIDAIVALRATESPGLWAQIVGRGFRVHESKSDCLVLDFGGNFDRHGPIDSEDYGRRKAKHGEKTGEAPTKECPGCEREVHAAARECDCGFVFPARELKHGTEADHSAAVYEQPPAPQKWRVVSWEAFRHKKRNGPKPTEFCNGCKDATPTAECVFCGYQPAPDTLKITYTVEPEDASGELARETISEWVCLEHNGDDRAHKFARKNASRWWENHSIAPVPGSISEALGLFNDGALARPATITTVKEGAFYRITHREIGKLPESWGIGDSWEGDEWETPAPVASEWETTAEEIPF